MPKEHPSPLVMTIGHSTHMIEEFIHLLQAHGATCVMQTPEFARSLDALIRLGHEDQIVLMCAEAVPWICAVQNPSHTNAENRRAMRNPNRS